MLIPKLPASFEEACWMIAFGDDNVVSVSPEVSTLFGPNDVQESLKIIGMEYTAADKSGKPFWKIAEETTFLKRTFTPVILSDGAKYVVPQMEKQAILNMFAWRPKLADPWRQKLTEAFFEASLHGEVFLKRCQLGVQTTIDQMAEGPSKSELIVQAQKGLTLTHDQGVRTAMNRGGISWSSNC